MPTEVVSGWFRLTPFIGTVTRKIGMRSVFLAALGLVLSLSSLPVRAQRIEPSACTYDECALRIESGNLVRGVSGKKVERLGFFFSSEIAKHVATSDSALRYARMYERNHSPGTVLLFVGEGAALGALGWFEGQWKGSFPSMTPTRSAIAIGGVALMLYGASKMNKAGRGLARAIWWYNRDLAAGVTR
jgi:hypothetical protein